MMKKREEQKKPVIAVIGLKGLPAFGGSARAGENMIAYLKNEFQFVVFNTSSHTSRRTGTYGGIRQVVFRKFFISPLNTIYYYLFSTFYCLFRGGFDVIHVFHVDASFIVPLLRLRYRVVAGHRARPQYADKWNPIIRHYFRFMEWLFFKWPAHVLTSVNREVIDIFSLRTRRQIFCFPNGVDLNNVRDLPEVEERDYVLFASGRVIAAKGAHLMLEALNQIHYQGRALVIGNRHHAPEYSLQLEKLAEPLNVRFMDIIKDKRQLMAWLKNARMFVFPSYHEGMSNMLLEAASVGVPVICSDIPGNRQVFNDDEAFFFQSGNAADLARKIQYVLTHPEYAATTAERGYERLNREYNWENLSQRYAGIYKWLMRNRKPLNKENSEVSDLLEV